MGRVHLSGGHPGGHPRRRYPRGHPEDTRRTTPEDTMDPWRTSEEKWVIHYGAVCFKHSNNQALRVINCGS
jgi:hypothetical protein